MLFPSGTKLSYFVTTFEMGRHIVFRLISVSDILIVYNHVLFHNSVSIKAQ